jgi:nucleotide-binding universal stress UspA family protein
MSKIIVSYDDTANDRDALALASTLAAAGGADLILAYVRHNQSEDAREALEQRDAEALLARGVEQLGAPAETRVVVHASTAGGLRELAQAEGADVVVFGSDYRTPVGAVNPGASARRLLENGPVAVAVATADLRSHAGAIARVGVLTEDGDDAPRATAESLASVLGATVAGDGPVDLLVVGSRPEAGDGRVMPSASAEYAIETASSPVLVVGRGAAVRFDGRRAGAGAGA